MSIALPFVGMRRLFLRFYLTVVVCFLVSSLAIGAIYKRLIDRTNQRYLTDIFQTTITIIEKELGDLPPSLWHDLVSQLRAKIPVPVQIEGLDTYTLSKRNQKALIEGNIILLDDQGLYLHRIHQTNQIVVLGPIPYLARFDAISWEDWLALGLMCIALGIPTWLWMRPFWRDLLQLIRQSRAFGQGDFSARVSLRNRSALAQLGSTFNQMAHNVQELTALRKGMIDAVSHDLRTPLARLRYRVEALRGGVEVSTQLAAIDRDLEHIDELIQEWLTLSSLDKASIKVEIQSIELLPWLKRLAQEYEIVLRQIIIMNHTQQATPTINADSYYLERAMGNLLSNASRYGGTCVQIMLEWKNNTFYIHIDDNGPGIPSEARERLMRPFERLERSRNRNTGGFGLGLSIVSMVMQAHKGKVEIADSPLGGTRISLIWSRD